MMREQDLKDRITYAAEKDVPDVKLRIKSDPRFLNMPHQRRIFPSLKPIRAMGYAVAVIVVALLLVSGLRFGDTAYATVHLSYNPAFSIDIDEDWTVLGITPYNDEADSILDALPPSRGKRFDDVFDELTDLVIDHGYLEDGGSISFAVEGVVDEARDRVTDHVRNRISERAYSPFVQDTGNLRDDAPQRAQEAGISIVTLAMIEEILERYPDQYDFETLAALRPPALRAILNGAGGVGPPEDIPKNNRP